MCRIERKVSLALVAAFLLGQGRGGAETAIQVSVDCTVGGMAVKYGGELPKFLDQLRFQLVQDLQGSPGIPPMWPDLAYWKFAQGSSPASPNQCKGAEAPQLRLSVFESKAGPIKVKMDYCSPLEPSGNGSWDVEWMARGHVRAAGYPGEDKVVGILLDFIEKSIIAPNVEPLRRKLVKSAPLAAGGIWDSAVDLRLVLPLPWEHYGPLSQAEFRLACSEGVKPDPPKLKDRKAKDQGVDEPELLSCGTGMRGMFTESNHPSYPAVAVAPVALRSAHWEKPQSLNDKNRARARQLRPLRTYLDEDPPALCSNKGMEVIQ
jgi:hypothetical protein